MKYHHKLILASQSPRRRELIGYLFENTKIISPLGEEPLWQNKGSPDDYLELCTRAKWEGARRALEAQPQHKDSAEDLLLVADTIVVFGKRVLGKPRDSKDAVQSLLQLSGKKHKVKTGLRLGWAKSSQSEVFEIVETDVEFRQLRLKEVQEYVRSGEPMDKAGSYGFQDKGMRLISKIEGPYTNVVGLPLEALRKITQDFLKL